MDHNFARGARIKPKPEPLTPINAEMPFHEFMAIVAIYAVRDYKVDRATFLKYAECGFQAASRSIATVSASTVTTGDQNG
jgi:hypothetical protein